MSDESTELLRQQFREECITKWRQFGNLTEVEMEELADFEIVMGPNSVTEELRRYYLLLKVDKPQIAEGMLAELESIDKENLDEQKITLICNTLHRYWSGFLIHFDGVAYSSSSDPQGKSVRYV